MSHDGGPYRQSGPAPAPLEPPDAGLRAHLYCLRVVSPLTVFTLSWAIFGPPVLGILGLAAGIVPQPFSGTLVVEAIPLIIFGIVAGRARKLGVDWSVLLPPLAVASIVAALECWAAWGLEHIGEHWHGC